MQFLTHINWETVLVTSIVPLLTLAGIIYNNARKRKNTAIETSAATALKREPTWVELEESNRKLRAEMDEQRKEFEAAISNLEERFKKFEDKTNVRIGALSYMLHESARQWPEGTPGPVFEGSYLDALENTDVPYIWRFSRR